MSAPRLAISLGDLAGLAPCEEAARRVGVLLRAADPTGWRAFTAAEARAAGCTYEDIIWVAAEIARTDEAVARRLTGYLNDNAKRVLPLFEQRAPDDPRVRACIIATDDFLAGAISEAEWARAARAAWDAWAAWDARTARAARAAWAARTARAAWDARDRGSADFGAWQFDRLIDWLAPEAPDPLPMPRDPRVEERRP